MKWLYKLEYKYGKYYIPNLMTIVVIGMAAVAILDFAAGGALGAGGLSGLLSFNRAAIAQGQVWRIITFIFLPPGSVSNPFMLLIGLYFYFTIGRALENTWGGFRFNIYYFLGILGAIVAGLVTGSSTNTYLNLSLFLAFATLAPDTSFLLFFLIPVKAKWMAIVYALFLAAQIIFAFIASPAYGLVNLVSLLFSLVNYAIFFGRTLITSIQDQIRIQKNRRNWRR